MTTNVQVFSFEFIPYKNHRSVTTGGHARAVWYFIVYLNGGHFRVKSGTSQHTLRVSYSYTLAYHYEQPRFSATGGTVAVLGIEESHSSGWNKAKYFLLL